jgi:hypothetical protein
MDRLFRAIFFLVLTLLLQIAGTGPAMAQKTVLLPVADLSRGDNGLHLGLTRTVQSALERLNLDVVPMGDVLRFMSDNKVRSYHYLDSFLIQKIGRDLNAQLVLMGTVTETAGRTPAIGLSFTAYETGRGAPIWGKTAATSLREEVGVLGLGEPAGVEDLATPLIDQLLGEFHENVFGGFIPEVREYQLVGMQVTPAYVQGGSRIEARLKIRFLGSPPKLIGARSAAGQTYLLHDKKTNTWRGSWAAPKEEGSYPIDITLEWEPDSDVETLEEVARYVVINEPPGLTLEIKKGQRIGTDLAFNNHLLILPRLGRVTPLARWGLEILTDDGRRVVQEEHEGDIPERLVWEGKGSDGFKLANGTYEIVFHVYDLAGNHSEASRRVVFQSTPPKIKAQARVVENEGRLELRTDGSFTYPLVSWSAEIKSMTGITLLQEKGEDLPASLIFKPIEGEDNAFLTLTGEDLLGNRLRITRQKLALVEGEVEIEEQEAKSWVSDF